MNRLKIFILILLTSIVNNGCGLYVNKSWKPGCPASLLKINNFEEIQSISFLNNGYDLVYQLPQDSIPIIFDVLQKAKSKGVNKVHTLYKIIVQTNFDTICLRVNSSGTLVSSQGNIFFELPESILPYFRLQLD